MSHKLSNLYASRVFAEHPLALWALDDEFYFISLIPEDKRDLLTWHVVNNADAASGVSPASGLPLPDEYSEILVPQSSSPSYMEFVGDGIDPLIDLDVSKPTLCFAIYAHPFTSLIQSYEIGFTWHTGGTDFYDKKEITAIEDEWSKLFHTIDLPEGINGIRPYLKINFLEGAITNDYAIELNAPSVGQWSEIYHYDTTGLIPSTLTNTSISSLLPSSSPLGIKVVEADSYGLADNKSGYYIIDNNKMLSESLGMPMVYGSGNVTRIFSPVSNNMPSVVIPGQGFLNQAGRYKELTTEFWLRIYTKSKTPIKIFGQIGYDDGLYVEEEYLTLKIGRYSKSYFVGKWYRPMLIDIRYSPTIVSLLINGDLAFSIDIDQTKITFPFERNDWLGFFGHEDIHPFDIDCVAIYPYIVPDQLAKKRYVYAQGVDNAENVVNNVNGESIFVDFPFAKYTSTMNYPDMSSWNAGFFNNLDANNRFLTFPNYSLPEIIYVGTDLNIFTLETELRNWEEVAERTVAYWTEYSWQELELKSAADSLIDNFFIQEGSYPFIKLKPNDQYDNVYGTIYFDSFNPLINPLNSFFGMFQAPETLPSTPEILFQINNKNNNNVFKITISDQGIKYLYNSTEIASKSVTAAEDFIAGFSVELFSQNFASSLNNFFANPQNLSLNVGGYANNTFSGKIYSVTFNNKLFNDKDLLEYIDEDGVFGFGESYASERGSDTYLMTYIGGYTYHPMLTSDSLYVDIGCIGYWEDSVPLSYFAKYVKDENQNDYYDLDMLQFNIDNPTAIALTESMVPTLDEDLIISSFLTIQDSSSVGNKNYNDYTNTEIVDLSRVLDIDDYTYNEIISTKFRIVDGTIIYPPKDSVDFEDYYITTHIELRNRGILNSVVRLKRMSYSSVAYDDRSFHSIGTRTGKLMYPFTRYDEAYSYKAKNPFVIHKDSTPYLYLTADSGISVLPYNNGSTRGISVPINQEKTPEYILGGLQFWAFYNKDIEINQLTNVGKIKTSLGSKDIFLIPETGGRRGYIKIFDSSTGIEDPNIVFYQNGEEVSNPYIYPQTWTSIIIALGEDIILDSRIGQLELYEGFVFNNIAFYQKASTVYGRSVVTKNWLDIAFTTIDLPGPSDLTVPISWNTYLDFQWGEIYDSEQIFTFGIDGENINKSFFGLSTVVSKDNAELLVSSDSFKIVSNANWSLYSGKPV